MTVQHTLFKKSFKKPTLCFDNEVCERGETGCPFERTRAGAIRLCISFEIIYTFRALVEYAQPIIVYSSI